ncbi:MAG: hypothetical protein M3Q45_14050 [Chloroflexota bacterium]|nr:hypothetical protein [Chloroflexota bacterium]
MAQSTLVLPVSVEQVAVAVKQMSQAVQRRLLELVPDLRQVAVQLPLANVEPVSPRFEELRAQVLAALDNRPLSPDELFLGGLTITQYDALTEQAKDKLWDQVAGIDLMQMEEVEAVVDALPA